MKLTERLALIKAGYTKKEIAAIESEESSEQQETNSEVLKGGEAVKDPEEVTEKSDDPKGETAVKTESTPEEAEDKVSKADYENIKRQLEDIQAKNRAKDTGKEESKKDIFQLMEEILT